jgi:hypothetical protein
MIPTAAVPAVRCVAAETRGRSVHLRRVALIAWCVCVLASCGGVQEDPPPSAVGPRWVPEVGTTWQYQLQGEVDTSVDAQIYDVDLFDVDATLVEELHRDGRNVICYVNAGAFENWRPDASRFPPEIVGEPLEDWRGEAWLDVRRLDVLEPIMAARFDLCRDKGFDAVDPDNIDGYLQNTGFPLTAEDQLRYNRMLARLAHERSLGVGLKNDVDQIEELVADFDFAVNESCVAEGECESLLPFIAAGKAVLHVEYELPAAGFCPITTSMAFSSIQKPRDLTARREACPEP